MNKVTIDYTSLKWDGENLLLLDQRSLPNRVEYFHAKSFDDCYYAIKEMLVRGAPLIAYTGLFSLALWARKHSFDRDLFFKKCDEILLSRPTAVNLRNEVEMLKTNLPTIVSEDYLFSYIKERMIVLEKQNQRMAKYLESYMEEKSNKSKYRVATLCNTGFLACGPLGTALGGIAHLANYHKIDHVFAFETRPYLQGARLTAFELLHEKIPFSLVVEGASAYLFETMEIDLIVVGADRIVANGDTANKIGTQMLGILSRYYNIPMVVMAPTSTFDLNTPTGDFIDIELRDPDEILSYRGEKIAPENASAWNPSFDLLRASSFDAIICEKGVISPLNPEEIKNVYHRLH